MRFGRARFGAIESLDGVNSELEAGCEVGNVKMMRALLQPTRRAEC